MTDRGWSIPDNRRGNIPEFYWDKSRTPTPQQFRQMMALFNIKRFSQVDEIGIQGDFEFVLDSIETLGDTRHFDTDALIAFMEGLPDR